jgi:translation initiation factor 3 subunit H
VRVWQVVLKIIKHSRDTPTDVVTGQLLGLDQDGCLEVTNCFAFPKDESEQAGEKIAQYQREMMIRLREVNVDSNTVGWYRADMSGLQDAAMVQSQFNYQSQIRNCVCIVYDPVRSSANGVALKAYRLTDTFMAMYKSGKFSAKGGDLPGTGVFEELPIKIKNSFLISGLLTELGAQRNDAALDFSGLDTNGLSTSMESAIESMHECVDELTEEQRRFQMWQRDSQRLHAQQAAIIAKRKAEGKSVDPAQFKEIPEPSRLESMLISNQIGSYASQLSQLSAQGMSNSFLMQGLAKDK